MIDTVTGIAGRAGGERPPALGATRGGQGRLCGLAGADDGGVGTPAGLLARYRGSPAHAYACAHKGGVQKVQKRQRCRMVWGSSSQWMVHAVRCGRSPMAVAMSTLRTPPETDPAGSASSVFTALLALKLLEQQMAAYRHPKVQRRIQRTSRFQGARYTSHAPQIRRTAPPDPRNAHSSRSRRPPKIAAH